LAIAYGFSALRRAEIAERQRARRRSHQKRSFSALRRAEIAERERDALRALQAIFVSVLFDEPKLLKDAPYTVLARRDKRVSVLFDEPKLLKVVVKRLKRALQIAFQCSSTSRNC